jgi:hypothetical protein
MLSTRNRLNISPLEFLYRARRFRRGEIAMPGRTSSTHVRVDPYPRVSTFDSVPIQQASPQLTPPDMQIGPYAIPPGSPPVPLEWQGAVVLQSMQSFRNYGLWRKVRPVKPQFRAARLYELFRRTRTRQRWCQSMTKVGALRDSPV